MTTHMKTLNLNLYAVPVALLIMAGGIGVQSASADPTSQHTTFEARFVINPADPAEKIYADIKRTAERLCENPGPRPLTLLRLERECTNDLVKAAVERYSRKDVADIHSRNQRG
jgi:hypothetical protein